MSRLHDIDYEQTTLLQLIQHAEENHADTFDLVRLSLDSGRELIFLAVTADSLDGMGKLLEGLQEMREEG
jgi:wyosine [tRNA(Phe)-imidazoG37] synthetase (radical SAM superfamily)